jgi:hypothetical protein
MAGLKGKSGPPGNMNAFKHGLAAIQKRRAEGIPTEHEESVRQQISKQTQKSGAKVIWGVTLCVRASAARDFLACVKFVIRRPRPSLRTAFVIRSS